MARRRFVRFNAAVARLQACWRTIVCRRQFAQALATRREEATLVFKVRAVQCSAVQGHWLCATPGREEENWDAGVYD